MIDNTNKTKKKMKSGLAKEIWLLRATTANVFGEPEFHFWKK